jgi:integrase
MPRRAPAMATLRLTPRGIAAVKTDQVQEEFWDDVVPGLALRVSRAGLKTFAVRYRANGTHRRLTLGRHPHLTLADARAAARKTLGEAQGGMDPALEQKQRRATNTTFAALAAEVLEAKAATTRPRTRRERQRIVDVELLPRWEHRPVASITRRDVVELVERIARRGAGVAANRTLGVIKVLFNEGLRRGFPMLEASPAGLVAPPHAETSRDRYLDRKEIKRLWTVLDDEMQATRTLFRFTLLTAQRIGSVCALRWADIDDADVWRIPAAAFKGKRPHLVPLSPEALAALDELRPLTGGDEFAFPARTDGATKHRNSVSRALQRINELSELPPWTLHDFRTTFRTHATRAAQPDHKRDPAGLGVAPHVADAVLGHKEASLGFDRYTAEPERYLLSEKRDALTRWGAFVRAAVEAR